MLLCCCCQLSPTPDVSLLACCLRPLFAASHWTLCCHFRQPLPPNTPEHGAALLAFVDEACHKLDAELKQQDRSAASLRFGSSNAPLAVALRQLSSHRPETCSASDLAPHVDLLLQLPPHLLLEVFLMLSGESAVVIYLFGIRGDKTAQATAERVGRTV